MASPAFPAATPKREAATLVHFAFLGKVFRVKGVFTLLEAIDLLPPAIKRMLRVLDLRIRYRRRTVPHSDRFFLSFEPVRQMVRAYGSYMPEEVPQILSRVDWVIVPSIWWENSPMVIQEAFANLVPVICSNIGGMAEKVTDGVDGLHFRVNDPRDLARAIEIGGYVAGCARSSPTASTGRRRCARLRSGTSRCTNG